MAPDPTTWRHRGAAAGYKNGDVNFKYTSNGYRILPETDNDWPLDGSSAPQCSKVILTIDGSSVVYDQHSDMFDFYPNLRRAITPYHAELIEQGLRLKDRDKGVKALAASENAAGSSQVVGPTVEATAAGEAMAVDNASPAGEAAPAQDATPADEATPGNGATATQQANATANVATAVVPATRRPFSRCPLGEFKPERLTQLPSNVTNEEIMTFFPRSMGRAEILSRVMDKYRFNDIAMYVNGAHGHPNSIAGPVIESSNIRHAASKTKDPSKFGPWKLPPGKAADVLLTDLVHGVVRLPPKGKGDGRLTKILRRVHFFSPDATLGSIMPLVEGQGKLDAASLRKYARQLVNNGY
ncbi:hypothetical protein H2199_007793 [Coniosporium tulheliwenetii]|uniref:Uncharacterized protein n=1 Tax=Coniosporium tulheliwenetii TaxID=3383036 RepID=A0ACC2YNZ7_9PEZI|nr:hypothetical protein H2199_007793 [Cladosporium sp. JES 115]